MSTCEERGREVILLRNLLCNWLKKPSESKASRLLDLVEPPDQVAPWLSKELEKAEITLIVEDDFIKCRAIAATALEKFKSREHLDKITGNLPQNRPFTESRFYWFDEFYWKVQFDINPPVPAGYNVTGIFYLLQGKADPLAVLFYMSEEASDPLPYITCFKLPREEPPTVLSTLIGAMWAWQNQSTWRQHELPNRTSWRLIGFAKNN